jgi:hypothetical protein
MFGVIPSFSIPFWFLFVDIIADWVEREERIYEGMSGVNWKHRAGMDVGVLRR